MTIELDEHIPKYCNQKEVTYLVEKHLINLWSINVSVELSVFIVDVEPVPRHHVGADKHVVY